MADLFAQHRLQLALMVSADQVLQRPAIDVGPDENAFRALSDSLPQ